MTVRQPRYSKEEFARRGDEIYESQVRSKVEEGNHGKIVAIDVDTGFNGWLSLPPDSIAELNLRWKRRGRAILGDGSECVFNVYEAVLEGDTVTWFWIGDHDEYEQFYS